MKRLSQVPSRVPGLHIALVAILASWVSASSAAGQLAPASLNAALSPRTAAELYFAAAQAGPAQSESAGSEAPRELATVKDAHRAHTLTALGAGITTGSVVGLGLFGRAHYCTNQERQLDRTIPRAVGGVVGTVGIGLLTLGILRVARLPERIREVPASPGRYVGLAAMAFGTALLSGAAVFLGAMPEEVDCWST